MQLVERHHPEAGVGGVAQVETVREVAPQAEPPVGTAPLRSAGCWVSALEPVCTRLES